MLTYEYTLTFKLRLGDEDPSQFLDKLPKDALVGIGRRGYIGLDFTRKGPSLAAVIDTTVKDIEEAVPGVSLVDIKVISVTYAD